MPLLGGVGKETALAAAKAVDEIVDDAIKDAQAAARGTVEQATFSAAAIVADIFNRANGAECPVDILVEATAKVRISGKLGALKFSTPEYGYAVSNES